jgi:cell wall-associated NlpC family hydrolase
MISVSKDEFFSYVGPRDIVPSTANEDYTVWETRQRIEVGRSWPGWKNPGGEHCYMLTESAYATLGKRQ